jgi:hypothetical protein
MDSEIGHELKKAWQVLGAEPDLMTDYKTGTGMYEAFKNQGADSKPTCHHRKLERYHRG